MRTHSARGSLGWVASRAVAQGFEFAAWVILARRLGADVVGVLAVAALIARMLGLVGDWGAAFRGPRDVVRDGRASSLVVSLVRRRERVSFVLTIAMAIGVVVAGHVVLLPMALAVFARGAGRDWIALGEARRLDAALPLLLQGAVICAGVGISSSLGTAAVAIGIGNLAGLCLSVHLNRIAAAGGYRNVAVDAWYLVAGIADQVLVSADTLLLALILSSTEAGIYVSVYRLPLAWISVIGLCTTAAVPIATHALGAGGVAPLRVHRIADRVAVGGALAVVPVAVVGLAIVTPLLGADFESGRTALVWLFVATGATTASVPYRVIYAALGSDRHVGVATTAAAVVNLVANVAVISRWGMEGAAATTLLTQIGLLVFFVRWSRGTRHDDVVPVGDQPSSSSSLAR